MKIRSAVDIWISILIWAVNLFIIAAILMLPGEDIIAGMILSLPVVGILCWFYFGTYYELRDTYLYCRSGPFTEKIPYESIKSLRPAKNLLSSMALARKRIEIRQHGKNRIAGTTYISPVDTQGFLDILKQKCHNIEQI